MPHWGQIGCRTSVKSNCEFRFLGRDRDRGSQNWRGDVRGRLRWSSQAEEKMTKQGERKREKQVQISKRCRSWRNFQRKLRSDRLIDSLNLKTTCKYLTNKNSLSTFIVLKEIQPFLMIEGTLTEKYHFTIFIPKNPSHCVRLTASLLVGSRGQIQQGC